MEACNVCYSACLYRGRVSMLSYFIRLNREWADICGFAAKVMQPNSPFAAKLCKLCAEYVRNVVKSLKKMSRIIVKNVPSPALDVQMHVANGFINSYKKILDNKVLCIMSKA